MLNEFKLLLLQIRPRLTSKLFLRAYRRVGPRTRRLLENYLQGGGGGTVGRWSLRDCDQDYNRISLDGIVTRLRGGRPWNYNWICVMRKKFVSLKETRPASEPTNIHSQLSHWCKRAECVGDHKPPLNGKVKNKWSYTSTHLSSIILWCLTNNKDSITVHWKVLTEGINTNYTHTHTHKLHTHTQTTHKLHTHTHTHKLHTHIQTTHTHTLFT
jgi:hypothetical protein